MEFDFWQRVEDCVGTRRSNCIGTALYLTGIQNEDKFVEITEAYESFFRRLDLREELSLGGIITWEKDFGALIDVIHAGIITSICPFEIMHRRGTDDKFFIGDSCSNSGANYYYYPNINEVAEQLAKRNYLLTALLDSCMVIRFGPAGLGPVATAEKVLEGYHEMGLKACEIAFTYSVYIKPADAVRIGKKAKELDIELSIHAPYFVNLNSSEENKIEATKKRILNCCEIGELLGAKVVVFHPGFYGENREEAAVKIIKGIKDIMDIMDKKKWKIKIAPETMGKVNVFGSLEEIRKVVDATGCSFCIDFAHILARYKEVDYAKVIKIFPEKEWHCHFSGIEYGDKGEKNHISTPREKWVELLEHLPKDKEIRIINESPTLVEDSVEGLGIYKKMN